MVDLVHDHEIMIQFRAIAIPVFLSVGVFFGQLLLGAEGESDVVTGGVERENGILFASPGGVDLLLDLYLPKGVENPPLLVFIHGGGWKGGDRAQCKTSWVADHGYAVASIEYRLSQEALFPAQIHDCKGALRWLRAHEEEYGYDASRVVVAGTSAGGHLVSLMGTSGEVVALEGNTGGNEDQSSRVQGVISYYGAHDFVKRSEMQPHKTDESKGAVYLLLGGPVKENLEAARAASPVTYVSEGDPPLLMLHGDQDPTVLLRQSQIMHQVYEDAGLDTYLFVVAGGGHGFAKSAEEEALVLKFLEKHLRSGTE